MCVGVEYLPFDILLHAKFEQKVIVNYICTPIIFKNPLETVFFIKNVLIIFCVDI